MKFNDLIPELSVSSIVESKRFYIDVLGFKLEYERGEDDIAIIKSSLVKNNVVFL